jgi:hypothetical protein
MMGRRNISQDERLALKKAWGNACAYCEKPVDEFEIDHIVAHSNGGTCDLDNLCVACPSCNRRKGATPIPKFYEGLLTSLAERKAHQVRKMLAAAPKGSRTVKDKNNRCEDYYKPASDIWRKSKARQICNSSGMTLVEYVNANNNCVMKLSTKTDGTMTSELIKAPKTRGLDEQRRN